MGQSAQRRITIEGVLLPHGSFPGSLNIQPEIFKGHIDLPRAAEVANSSWLCSGRSSTLLHIVKRPLQVSGFHKPSPVPNHVDASSIKLFTVLVANPLLQHAQCIACHELKQRFERHFISNHLGQDSGWKAVLKRRSAIVEFHAQVWSGLSCLVGSLAAQPQHAVP